jgi:hypothetical protein
VNASSTRNGKRILSQLQEATQSHRVSQNKGEGGQLLCSLTPSMLKKKYCVLLYVLSGETSNDNSIVLGLIKPTW